MIRLALDRMVCDVRRMAFRFLAGRPALVGHADRRGILLMNGLLIGRLLVDRLITVGRRLIRRLRGRLDVGLLFFRRRSLRRLWGSVVAVLLRSADNLVLLRPLGGNGRRRLGIASGIGRCNVLRLGLRISVGHKQRCSRDRFLRRQRFRVLRLDRNDRRLELLHLSMDHRFRRYRLHVLELPPNGATRLVVHLFAHLWRVFRQTVDGAADHRNKICHQYFLMVIGSSID